MLQIFLALKLIPTKLLVGLAVAVVVAVALGWDPMHAVQSWALKTWIGGYL